MKRLFHFILFSMFFMFFSCETGATIGAGSLSESERKSLPDLYHFKLADIFGDSLKLSEFKGKVIVIVNVASRCGLTPQYEELQAFYEEFHNQGVEVLGFPANNFMNQEPGTNEEIIAFCEANYGVTFPMFSKISVKGRDQHPLYAFLTKKEKNGVLDSEVSWNFQKFIIGRDGRVVASVAPRTSIFDEESISVIRKEIAKN